MKNRNWKIASFVILSLFISGLIAYKGFLFHDAVSEAGGAETITTTIYATLIAILLALLALAITAYVFVAGFLRDRQKPYEKKSINALLNVYTVFLIILTLSSLVSLLCCIVLDNMDAHISVLDWMPPAVIILSCAVSFFLLIYTCCIICHDVCLVVYARHARKKLFSSQVKSNFISEIDSVFKWIGDIEMLTERLIQNHKDSFHAPDDQSVLGGITSEEFAEAYEKLISYRDFLWVEGFSSRRSSFTYPEYHALRDAVRELENLLRTQFLEGERLQNQSFTAPFLSLSAAPLRLNGTVFTNSVFERNPNPKDPEKPEGIGFHKAGLQGADFTRARLNYVNLRGADCREAVFSDAVLNHIRADAKSCFERTVFQNTDFCGQKFSDRDGVMRFKSASFVNALLINCLFAWCDFRQASFHQAVMSSITLDSVCLSYSDLSGAILTNAKLRFQQEKGSRFGWTEYWLKTQLDENGQPIMPFIDSWEGRSLGPAFFVNLEACVLSQACIEDYNFVGSRMSNANFSDALLRHCILDRCYGQKATFQETVLENCRFAFAMFSLSDFSHAHIMDCDFSNCDLQDSLLIQTDVRRKGDLGSCFRKANFTHAQVLESHFTGCDFTLALFEDGDLRDTVFEDCYFKNTSFTNCNLRGVRFLRCDLESADFRGHDPAVFEITDSRGTYYLDKPRRLNRKRSERHGI